MTMLPVPPPARTRAEFLALDDRILVEYVSGWLLRRGMADDGDTLSQTEHEVMLGSLAFATMAGGGVEALVAHHRDDLLPMRDGLRQMSLHRHADVLARVATLPLDASVAAFDQLAAEWDAIDQDPTRQVAAYLRIHADQIAWQRMR